MTGYQLKLGVGKTRVPGQPGYALVPESVRSRLDASLFGVLGDDLLDTACRELAVSLGLEEPAVLRVGTDVRPQGCGEGLAEQHVPVFRAFALVDPDLAGFDINFGNSDVAEFTDPHRCEEQEPQHKGVLHILGTVHDLIEPPELLSGQHTGQPTPLLLGSQVTDLALLLCDIPPVLIIHTLLSDQAGDPGDELSLA